MISQTIHVHTIEATDTESTVLLGDSNIPWCAALACPGWLRVGRSLALTSGLVKDVQAGSDPVGPPSCLSFTRCICPRLTKYRSQLPGNDRHSGVHPHPCFPWALLPQWLIASNRSHFKVRWVEAGWHQAGVACASPVADWVLGQLWVAILFFGPWGYRFAAS